MGWVGVGIVEVGVAWGGTWAEMGLGVIDLLCGAVCEFCRGCSSINKF